MIPSESESASIAEAGEFHTALSEQVCLATISIGKQETKQKKE